MQTKQQLLKQTFGYDRFLKGQEELIDSILAGRDTLGIMPTGAGKSICFQIPALMMKGITLIISPLISLMKDQVNALTQAGIQAAFINSSLTERQIGLALAGAENGTYKLIYIAPERLLNPDFLSFAQNADISMLTVDEAHCISQWGQDFRPSYAKIPEFIACLEKRPILSAFTATATPKVREDIVRLLKLHDPKVLITGFDRPNLYFEVQRPRKKYAAVAAYLKDKPNRTGIIYCSTRAGVEEVCDLLRKDGYPATRYHAGLSDRERRENQEDFLFDRALIMVATNAFGMGIDKSNVSFVIHYNMPKDVESYYQEAGRAGRDGQNADCILLYSGRDVQTNLWLIENARDKEYPDSETETRLKERERARLREMTFYCTTNECLRGYMLRYFGETPENYCGNCGNCNSSFETSDITDDTRKILSCVARAKERYGAKIIIDTLRGSKNERLTKLGLDQLSTYAISEKSTHRLQEIIDYLILNQFLLKTDDEYPVLKWGPRAKDAVWGDLKLEMKVSNEREKAESSSERRKRQNAGGTVDTRLFEALRELRLQIAQEQQVAAYVVFSDSTLTDMCMKRPADSEAFLEVSGVGRTKLDRYGKRFLKRIAQFNEENGGGDSANASAPATPAVHKAPVVPDVSKKPVSISMVADQINCILLQTGRKKISGQRLNDWLIKQGYLQMLGGTGPKTPTAAGEQAGIHGELREIRGEKCMVNLYDAAAQQMIHDRLYEIVDWRDKQ